MLREAAQEESAEAPSGLKSYDLYIAGKDVAGDGWVYTVSGRSLLEDVFTSVSLKRSLEQDPESEAAKHPYVVGRCAIADDASIDLATQAAAAAAARRAPRGAGAGRPAAAAAPGQIQLDLAYLTVTPGVAGHLEHGLDGEFASAHQPEGVGGGAGLDDGVGLVEDHCGGAEHRENGVHAGREYGIGVQGSPGRSLLVAFAPAERQHGDDTGEHPGDRCRCGDRRVHVHASRLGMVADLPTADRVRPRTLVAQSSPRGQYRFIWEAGNGRVRGTTWERGVRTAGSAAGPPDNDPRKHVYEREP